MMERDSVRRPPLTGSVKVTLQLNRHESGDGSSPVISVKAIAESLWVNPTDRS